MKAGGAALFIAWIAVSAFATTIELVDLDQLTESADVIVIATVVSSESRWEKAHTDIGTLTEIKISSVVKSAARIDTRLTLHHPGGSPSRFEQKNWRMNVDGLPDLQKGKHGMFFLEKHGAYYQLVGWAQGFFEIQRDSSGNQIVTRNFGATLLINRGSEEIPRTMTLNRLVTEVKRRLQ